MSRNSLQFRDFLRPSLYRSRRKTLPTPSHCNLIDRQCQVERDVVRATALVQPLGPVDAQRPVRRNARLRPEMLRRRRPVASVRAQPRRRIGPAPPAAAPPHRRPAHRNAALLRRHIPHHLQLVSRRGSPPSACPVREQGRLFRDFNEITKFNSA